LELLPPIFGVCHSLSQLFGRLALLRPHLMLFQAKPLCALLWRALLVTVVLLTALLRTVQFSVEVHEAVVTLTG
jgi:hypothetical protein